MTQITGHDSPHSTTGAGDRLSPPGRAVRLVATAVGVILLLAGTLAGQDDHFPFGPFRMFSTTDSWDEPISIARAEIIDTTGARIELTEGNSGVRRAEIEGQLDRFRADPTLLIGLADAYRTHNPGRPTVVMVTVLLRNHQISRRGPTGRYTDEVVATWRPG
jgi:hypothetical protein